MPYSNVASVPDYVPKSKRRQWLHVFNSEWEKHKDTTDSERERIAFSAANSVAGPNASKKYAKLLHKSVEDDAKEFADAVIKSLKEEWETLPAQVREPLQSSMSSGIGQGLLQIEFSNAGMIAAANRVAQAYAVDRAAELVGMKYDDEGNLVENPNAQWAISDTTRDRIRQIIAESFEEETPISEIKDAIQEALEEEATGSGIFSEARADLIARTEVARAQVGGNFDVWQKSGVVKSIKWLTSEDERVCDVCDGNDNVVVQIGKPFPSGDIMPGAHPLCRCICIVAEVSA